MKTKWLKLTLIVVLIALISLTLVGCNEYSLDAPTNLKYNGATITWNKVENADHYMIQINDGDEKKSTSASLSYAANGKTFSVKITAVSEGKIKDGKSNTTEKTFQSLPKIDNISFQSDGTASWGAINNATGYAIKLNGVELDETVTAAQFSNFADGQNTIQIRPIATGDDGWYSVWSEAKTITKLGMPTNITYDGEYLRWNAPATSVVRYEVIANGVLLSDINGTSAKFDSKKNNFTVTVKSIGNHQTSFDSEVSEAKSFVYFETVSNITIEDGVVNWPLVNGADGYIVKVDNAEYPVTTNSYAGLPANITKTVSVKPTSSDTTYFSNFCIPKNVHLLPAPEVSWVSGHDAHIGTVMQSIQWQEIVGASGYMVKMTFNGSDVKMENLSKETRSCGYAFLETGEYKVYIKATATGANTYDSVYGTPVTVTRLAAPTPSSKNFIISNKASLEEGFRVNFNSVIGAAGYQLYEDEGLLLDYYTTTNQFHVTNVLGNANITVSTNIKYKIGTKGSVSGLNVKLDSLPSKGLDFEISVQAMPQKVRMDGFILTWNEVKGAEYNISLGIGEFMTSITNQRDLSNISPGTYDVIVNSCGNSSNILPSPFSAGLTLTRLSAPTQLKVTTDASEGQLKYDDNNNLASAYRTFQIWIDGEKKGDAVAGTFANINAFITENVSNVFVRINANSYDKDHPEGGAGSIYYMTSPDSETLKLAKLKEVTFATDGSNRFTNTQFLWNAPSNQNANGNYASSYIVYKGANANATYHNGVLKSTELNISELPAGEHIFAVKAIGDGVRYLNSDMSNVEKVTKLQTPIVGINNNMYEWNAISSATNYAVKIDGEKVLDAMHQANGKYSFAPGFRMAKQYTVEVYAIGDNGATTIDSAPHKFQQNVKKLSNPTFTFRYSDKVVNVKGTINFKVTTQATMGNGKVSTKGYSYNIGGSTNPSEEKLDLEYSRIISTPGTHTLSIKAVGGDFDGTEIGKSAYYIESDTVGGGGAYKITILGQINHEGVRLNMDNILSWPPINDTICYEYEFVFDGAAFTNEWTKTASAANFGIDISAFVKEHKSITIRIRAAGDGNNIISGEHTEVTLRF